MTKRLALSAALATALAAGSAFAAGDMQRSSDMQQGGSAVGATSAQAPSNDSVRMIQQALQNEGYDVQVDGVYGPNTRQALESFQQQHSTVAAGPSDSPSGMSTQQAQTPDTMGSQGNTLSPVDRPEAGNTATQNLGWDRAGGIKEGAAGQPGDLGTGRGEEGVGGQ